MNLHIIWDLDGTLIDSSNIIAEELNNACNKFNLKLNKNDIYEVLKKESTSQYIETLEKRFDLEKNVIKNEFSYLLKQRNGDIKLRENAFEVLQYLNDVGVKNYICTNKGKNTYLILKEMEIYDFFKDVITSADVEKKKPSPEGINIILKKYKINQNNVIYIGDKLVDVKAACCAEVKSINLNISSCKNNKKINSLDEIITIINEELI